MGQKNFMEARTEIEGYISKLDDVKRKIAGIVVEACETRAKSGKTANMNKDMDNLLSGLTEDDKNDILKEAIILMTKRLPKSSNRNNDDYDDEDDDIPDVSNIFRKRGF